MKSIVLLLAMLGGLPPIVGAAQGAELVEYDPRSFSRLGAVPLRPEALQRPDRLTVNFRGQVLEECGSVPLIGWLTSEKLLLLEEQGLVVLDARTGTRSESSIPATSPQSVFLVRE